MANMAARNTYVGAAKMLPDSRMPRRLARVTSATAAMPSSTLNGSSVVTAETSWSMADAIDTDTVRM